MPAMVMVQRRVNLSSGSSIRSGDKSDWCFINLLYPELEDRLRVLIPSSLSLSHLTESVVKNFVLLVDGFSVDPVTHGVHNTELHL